MARHQFELLEDDDEFIMDNQPSSSQENQSTSERSRLPSWSWILWDTIAGVQSDSLQSEPKPQVISPDESDQVNDQQVDSENANTLYA